MFRIYDKNVIAKELFTVNLDSSEIQSVMGGNLFLDHLELNPDDCCVVEQTQEIQYPTYDELEDTVREMTLFERYKNKLYQLDENEVILNNEIIRLEEGQYLKNGEIKSKEKIEGTRVEWNWKTNEWEEKATNLEIVQAQYSDYEGMDTPSTLEEMKQQDPALVTEYLNMMIELRSLIYTLSTAVQPLAEDRAIGFAALPIPQPSEKLKEFKNRFKLTK